MDDGRWIDASALMLSAGYGQWMPKKIEPVHNLEYRKLFDAARAAARTCGTRSTAGPGPRRICAW